MLFGSAASDFAGHPGEEPQGAGSRHTGAGRQQRVDDQDAIDAGIEHGSLDGVQVGGEERGGVGAGRGDAEGGEDGTRAGERFGECVAMGERGDNAHAGPWGHIGDALGTGTNDGREADAVVTADGEDPLTQASRGAQDGDARGKGASGAFEWWRGHNSV